MAGKVSTRGGVSSLAMRRGLCLAVPGLLLALGSAGAAQANLTITPTFDSTITGSSDKTTIETDINNAISFYNNNFINPITVSIYFTTATPPGVSGNYLGASQSSFYNTSYDNYKAALGSNANNDTVAQTAYNHLSSGNQPTSDSVLTGMKVTAPDLRVLCFSGAVANQTAANGNQYDGIIYLNSTYLSGFGGGGNYSPTRVIQHEVDEVLGIGGAGSQLNNVFNNQDSTNSIGPMDLFRYAAAGKASFTTSGTASSYFSIDGGTTPVVSFNQNPSQPTTMGDFGDWGASTTIGSTTTTNNYVQNAFSDSSAGTPIALTSPEGIALQAIGYDTPVPEVSTLALFGVALVGLVLLPRKRRPSAPAKGLDPA
ncbi:MAG: PEP-CTERM sorting domain-containing protein [Phycisphaerae bacterium]|nr:PEP-CTERM sorting domain-containing protein [Phycisphaerae bacterium]